MLHDEPLEIDLQLTELKEIFKRKGILDLQLLAELKQILERKEILERKGIPLQTLFLDPKISILKEVFTDEHNLPPIWCEDIIKHKDYQLLKEVKVYHNSSEEDLSTIKLLCAKKEPNHRGDIQSYNFEEFKELFGLTEPKSHYQTFLEQQKLLPKQQQELPPPYIIYTPSPINLLNYNDDQRFGSVTEVKFFNEGQPIHIINASGLLFDTVKQADYIYFESLTPEEKNIQFEQYYTQVFTLIFKAAQHLGKNTIVFSLFGAGNACQFWFKGADELKKMWAQVFLKVYSKFKENGFTIYFMGINGTADPSYNIITTPTKGIEDIGFFPQCLKDLQERKTNIDDCIFINASNNQAMLGNGNYLNSNLDGIIGTRSVIGYSGTPFINSFIQYVAIPD